MNMSDSLFPVMEESIQVEGLKNSTDYKFIINAETSEVLSCMTDEYRLLTNEDVIKKAMPVLKDNGAVLTSVNMFNNGARTTYRYRFPKITVKIDKDELHPEVIIKNSYDGSTNIDALAGAFRLVCSNGAVIGVVIEKYKNKHIMSNIALENIEQVITETIEKTTILFKKEFPILHQTKIREDHLLDLIGLFPSTMSSFLTQKLIADRPKTFWDLFNVATYITTHNMERSNEATHKLEDNIYKIMRNLAMREKARA